MKKNSFIMVLASVTIIFIVVGFFFFQNGPGNSPVDDYSAGNFVGVNLQDGETMEVVVDDSMGLSDVTEMAMTEGGLTAGLRDVAASGGSGVAYLYRDGALYHYVEADLPEPTDGNVYEGWLVSQTPTLQYFSTGVMDLNPDGVYTFSFMTDAEYPGYDHVIITEETLVDAAPETHILEGTLQ